MSQQWWFCLQHSAVEDSSGCANTDRMGPYASRDEAASALDTAAKKTEAWDNDPTWEDGKD